MQALSQGPFLRAVGQKAEVTDAHEAHRREDVGEEEAVSVWSARDRLESILSIEGHGFQLVFLSQELRADYDPFSV